MGGRIHDRRRVAVLRSAFWGGLRHHDQACDECGGTGVDDEGECYHCDGERKFFWGSFYGQRGECEWCKRPARVASMGDDGEEYICLRCYLDLHRSGCGCDRWARVESAVRWPEKVSS